MQQPEPISRTFPQDKTVVYCVGAQKAGTTWLSDYVSDHPRCHVPALKECHFFEVRHGFDMQARRVAIRALQRKVNALYGSTPEQFSAGLDKISAQIERSKLFAPGDRGFRNYLKFMTKGSGDATHLCEFTPAYATCDRTVFAEMDALANHQARFVFVLRDPVERAWSQARMAGKEALELDPSTNFEQAATKYLKHYLGDGRAGALPRADYRRTILELEAVIPRERILYLFYETLFCEPSIRRFCDFLGIEQRPANFSEGSNVGRGHGFAIGFPLAAAK